MRVKDFASAEDGLVVEYTVGAMKIETLLVVGDTLVVGEGIFEVGAVRKNKPTTEV